MAERPSGLNPRLVAGIALVALLLVFVFENTRRTSIRFIVPEVDVPLWVALFVAVLIGGIAGALLARSRR